MTRTVERKGIGLPHLHFKLHLRRFKGLLLRDLDRSIGDETAARRIEGIFARVRRRKLDQEFCVVRLDIVAAEIHFVFIALDAEGRIGDDREFDIDRFRHIAQSGRIDDLEHEAVLTVKHLGRGRYDAVIVLTERRAVDRDIHAALAERRKLNVPAAEALDEHIGLIVESQRMTVHACFGDDVRIGFGPLAFLEVLDLCIVVIQEEIPAIAFDRLRIRIFGRFGIARSLRIILQEVRELFGERNDAVTVDNIGVRLHKFSVVVVVVVAVDQIGGMEQLVAVRLDVDEVSAVEEEAARARDLGNDDGTRRSTEVIIAVRPENERIGRAEGIDRNKDAVLLRILLRGDLLRFDHAHIDVLGRRRSFTRALDHELGAGRIAVCRQLDAERLEGGVDVCRTLVVDLKVEGLHVLVLIDDVIIERVRTAVIGRVLGDGCIPALDIDAVLARRGGLEGVEDLFFA